MTQAGEAWMEFLSIIPTLDLDSGGDSIEDGGRFVVAGTIKGEQRDI